MGRFLQQDPLFEAFTGHSSYSYGFNNPVMFGDPSGLAPEKHKSGGGGQDVLLGSSAINDLLKDIFSSVSPLVEYRTEWTAITIDRDGLYLKTVEILGVLIEGGSKTTFKKTTLSPLGPVNTFVASSYAYTPSAASMNPAGTGGGGGGSSSASANDNGSIYNTVFDYDAAKARVFEFTHDWNTINKLEHAADLANLFLYYLDNPSAEGEVYKGGFLFLKTLAHYQTGVTDVLLIDASILDLSKATIVRDESANIANIAFPGVDWNNLFTFSSIMNFGNLSNESLSIGKIKATIVDNGYLLHDDTYDFNIEWAEIDWNDSFGVPNMILNTFKSGRNVANCIGGIIHNIPFLFSGNYGAFANKSFKLRFTGVAKK